ncbi:MAG: ArnT family glycosyltransferase [Bacteroidia bacterium]
MQIADRRPRWQDFRIWIGLFFLIRLIGITHPPLEAGHNWRQALTTMTARVMHEEGPDLFHPKVTYGGTGYQTIASEFPIFNYLMYLTAKPFGFDHWHGRLINLIISSLGLWFFFRLVREVFDEKMAFKAGVLLLFSIWFSFSRKIMPDTFSVSLVIMGMYAGWRWLQGDGWRNLLIYSVLLSLGLLSKIPALTVLAAFGMTLFARDISWRKKGLLYTVSLVAVVLAGCWYGIWVPKLQAEGSVDLYFPRSFSDGLRELWEYRVKLADTLIFAPGQSYAAFITVLAGAFLVIKKRNKRLLGIAAWMLTAFVVFMILAGSVFALHNYYMIPITPLFALLGAFALHQLNPKYAYILLALICLESLGNQSYDFQVREKRMHPLELEAILDTHVPKGTAIIINGGLSPQPIYFAHRSGWSVSPDACLRIAKVEELHDFGAQFLVIDRHRQKQIPDIGTRVYEGEHYILIKL